MFFKFAPDFIQNLMISFYNIKAYKIRYGGKYKEFRELYKKNESCTLAELKRIQSERFSGLINFARKHSEFYSERLKNISNPDKIENIENLPILSKEELRENIKRVIIQTGEKLEKAKTGGTTGKSLEVRFRNVNTQERFAMLDHFRSQYGYELGKKTAWFSGKNLLTGRDLKKNRFWKTDYLNKVRYYSTFHIKQDYLKYYLEDLIKFQPEYMVGFPSNLIEIAKYGLANNCDFPAGVVKAVFPTAESVTDEMRKPIEKFFKTRVYNQYASSEGAPFIFECKNQNLHLEIQSGVFEVLDENNQPAQSGRMILTSFTTEGTPLIRYDIGDSITLEDENIQCSCGNHNPLVKEILGRIDDFVYSPENGKINLGNVSNTLKDTSGIIRFQAIQDSLDKITILIITDPTIYNQKIEQKFIQNWRDRIGDKMELEIKIVKDIPFEKSGKFRIVKNYIKNLI